MPSFLLFSIFLFCLGININAEAQSRSELEKLSREVVNYELQDQDLEKAKSYFSPEATFQWPNGSGEDLTTDKFIDWRKQQSENVKNEAEIKSIQIDGNESTVFAVWRGKVLQDANNPERVGKVATVPFVYRYIWDDGKITRMEMYWDSGKIQSDLEGG